MVERRNKCRELCGGKNATGTLGAKARAVKGERGGKGAFRFEAVANQIEGERGFDAAK